MCTLVGCLVLLLLAQPAHCQRPSADVGLPPESELPGSSHQQAALPGESVLPGSNRAEADDLPGENEIPGTDEAARGAGNVVQDSTTPIAGQTPILRLAFEGHTGRIRTLDISDGGRTLVSAGDDKEVHVWRRTDVGETGWLHRRTIRWPVTRGPRGRIYAARLDDDHVAFAGHGAFGYLGEIRVVDAASGELVRALTDLQPGRGHRQNVVSLSWSPSGESRLASVDMEGRLTLWAADPTSGIWNGRMLVDVDATTYGAQIAALLAKHERRAFVPVTFVSPNYVVVPRFVGPIESDKKKANWHLQRVDVRDGTSALLNDLDHVRHVRSLSATNDGRVLASCDWGGSVGVWTFDPVGAVVSAHDFRPQRPPIFVNLDPAGTRLLVGTEVTGKGAKRHASIQLWDLTAGPPRLLSQRAVDEDVIDGVLDADHRQAIVTQGSSIEVHAYAADGTFTATAPDRLTVPAKPVLKVAFNRQPDSYSIAFGWSRSDQGKKRLDGVFDLAESRLLGRAPIDPDDYLQPQRTAVRWQVGGPFNTPQGPRYRLFEGDQPRAYLTLVPDLHGEPTTVCTLPTPPTGAEEPDENPHTGAVVVGTEGRNNIYVYKADQSDPPELLRQFRDHSGQVLSVSSSADGKYLVSSGSDSTISVWNLQDIYTASKSVNRWGAEFEMDGGRLVATSVREDGPLYFRGVRAGDRLVMLEWTDHQAKPFAEADPTKMKQRLLDSPFDFLVHMKFMRLGRLGPDFQSYPAWRPLATLFVDQSREWAFWTPSGFYDASFNGHQRFGWQINKRFGESVDYFRAAQFRKQLERPDVMRRLLAAGSLSAAMRQTVSQIGPPPAERAIVNQIRSKPNIRLLAPAAGTVVEGDSLVVTAEIETPLGATLINPRAFVSGVPAVDRQRVTNRADAAENVVTYQWEFRLPSDELLQLEILAATESEALDRVLVDLEHRPSDVPLPKPRLHVLAIGVSEYRDPQIQSLDFAAKAASDISKLFRTKSASIYRATADELVDSDATKPLWRVYAQDAVAQLRQAVSPDDLVVMYLCGHGLRDRQTNQWYFVTSEARYNDLMNDQYDDCIAFSDLAALAKLPCRKLAILDSCHSGAVQPLMRSEDLKSALRFLQDDVVLTLTASEGDEEAAEQSQTRMGRFTAVLVDALNGMADNVDDDGKGTVTLTETIDYVTRRVAAESVQDGMPQHPTASPNYLLRTLQLPLTTTESP